LYICLLDIQEKQGCGGHFWDCRFHLDYLFMVLDYLYHFFTYNEKISGKEAAEED